MTWHSVARYDKRSGRKRNVSTMRQPNGQPRRSRVADRIDAMKPMLLARVRRGWLRSIEDAMEGGRNISQDSGTALGRLWLRHEHGRRVHNTLRYGISRDQRDAGRIYEERYRNYLHVLDAPKPEPKGAVYERLAPYRRIHEDRREATAKRICAQWEEIKLWLVRAGDHDAVNGRHIYAVVHACAVEDVDIENPHQLILLRKGLQALVSLFFEGYGKKKTLTPDVAA